MRLPLRVLRDLEPINESNSRELRPTGGKPAFVVEFDGDGPTAGWNVVTVDVSIDDALASARSAASPITLRFLPAGDQVPLARRPVPEIRGKRFRVVHIPEGTARIEVEVSPWVSAVRPESISLRPINSAVAASMMSSDLALSSAGGNTDRALLVDRLRGARTSGGIRRAVAEVAYAYEHLQHQRAGNNVHYPDWLARHSTLFNADRDRLAARCEALPGGGPSISVVMPVYDPEPELLREAIDSVRQQVYSRWQLVCVNDASTNPEIAEILDEAAASDSRILVRHRSENGHICAATNDAIDIATGEFVAFMDHDDLLASFALAAIGLAARDADLIYTDEDKIDRLGQHFDPHFKPDWNPELLLGQNYLSHLTAVRRSLLRRVGGLRVGYEGSQDHDLMLRLANEISPDRVVHLPLVAYHWRAIEGSTAFAPGEKSYTEDASIRALQDHLGPEWEVDLADGATAYRCKPPLNDFPMVSILIPTRDRIDLVEQCVESLAQTTYPAFEIVIIDNDSTEPRTLEWFEQFDNGRDRRVVAAPGEFNFSHINNVGAEQSTGELILLLNNDTEVIDPNWLTTMVRWIQQPGIGIVGAKLLYPNDTIQHAGVVLGLGGLAGHGQLHEPAGSTGYFNRLTITHEVGAVTGACLLTWRDDWDSVGGLDVELAVAFNDIDYCLGVRHNLGRRILWCADASLYHHESLSRGAEDDPAKVERFNAEVDLVLERWADVLHEDPAYSPNLTLSRDSFSLAREPRVVLPWSTDSVD